MNYNKTKDIFMNYRNEIISKESRKVEPTSNTSQNLNSDGNDVKFIISSNEEFISLEDICVKISGTYSSKDATKAYDGSTSTVKMINNFVAHLFDRIEVSLNNTLVDRIEEIGTASTVQGCVSHDSPYGYGKMEMNSFKSIAVHGGNFNAYCSLADLGLGFFKIDLPLYNTNIEIVFRRNNDDNVLYRWGSSSTTPNEGKIEIKEMYLKVPFISYDSLEKRKLLTELDKEPHLFVYNQWQCIKLYDISGQYFIRALTDQYRNTINPSAAFVIFKKDKEKSQLVNNDSFDHMNVKNIHIEISGKRYPLESWNLNWDKGDYMLAYNAYCFFKNNFVNKNMNCLETYKFKDEYPIYAFDLTKQPEEISGRKANIILNVDFDKNVTAAAESKGTVCYVILYSRKMFKFDYLTGNVDIQN